MRLPAVAAEAPGASVEEGRATLADLGFAALEGPTAPADFAVILRFPRGRAPSPSQLEQGALRSRRAYPRSSTRLVGNRWRTEGCAPPPVATLRCADAAAQEVVSRGLLADPLRADAPSLIRQTLLEGPEESWLVTQVHHALGDLVSAVLWLRAQLEGTAPPGELRLRRHPRPARRSRYAASGASPPLREVHSARITGRRRWRTQSFAPCGGGEGFTYNDVLAAVALRAMHRWNGDGGRPVALWMPVSVRHRPFEGFGNGSSRIRVYGDQRTTPARVREQVEWSKTHGEWAVPRWAALLPRAPSGLVRAALRAQVRRPGVDMATTLFSHAERLADGGAQPFADATAIEVVSHLIPAHPFTVAAVGHGGRTQLTFTWDEGRFSDADASQLVALFEAERRAVFAEVDGRG